MGADSLLSPCGCCSLILTGHTGVRNSVHTQALQSSSTIVCLLGGTTRWVPSPCVPTGKSLPLSGLQASCSEMGHGCLPHSKGNKRTWSGQCSLLFLSLSPSPHLAENPRTLKAWMNPTSSGDPRKSSPVVTLMLRK